MQIVVEQLYLCTLGCHLVSDMVYKYHLLNQMLYQENLQQGRVSIVIDKSQVLNAFIISFRYVSVSGPE